MWQNEVYDLSLLDENFLSALIEQKEHEIYARIASLDINELPIDYIEGKVTSGSINLDGDSSVRRTCSLSMTTNEVDVNDYYWGIKTKFKLEIGLRNNLNNQYAPSNVYPDIVWFKQGTFVISSFNTSISTNSCSISISGKDKMCMLNGDLGGQLFASVDFGTEEFQNKVFTEASATNASSDILIARKYYFIPDDNDIPGFVYKDDLVYSLAIDALGQYYRDGDTYRKMIDGQEYIGSKYKIYQAVLNPSDLFVLKPDETVYSPGAYYYEKYDDYYLLDTANNADPDRIYYMLRTLYEINYEYDVKKLKIDEIIRESVHTYAKEPYHNIIINDLEDYGLEQLTYKGDKPLVAFRDNDTGHFVNYAFIDKFNNNNCEGFSINYNAETKQVSASEGFVFDSLTSENMNNRPTIIYIDNKKYKLLTGEEDPVPENLYTIALIQYGDDIGYRVTDLTYPGDLVSSVGDSLTAILDKIKTMLGDYEYFYDIDGRFVFQRKRTYVNVAWSQFVTNENEKYITYANERKKFSFNFEGNRLISAIQNSPALNNLRNDFIVWGSRQTAAGAQVPIHARYAIDTKPTEYYAFNGVLYYTKDDSAKSQNLRTLLNNNSERARLVDWRELIYRMAIDTFQGQGCSTQSPVYYYDMAGTRQSITSPDHYLYAIAQLNPERFPTGYTGYEQYYTDMEGFWRQLYDPDYIHKPVYAAGYYSDEIASTDYIYYKRVKEWHAANEDLIDLQVEYFVPKSQRLSIQGLNETYNDLLQTYSNYFVENDDPRLYWNIDVFDHPETLNFWIEFLDDGEELQQFAVAQVGDRTKVVNDDKVSAIIFKEIPDIILYDTENDIENLRSKLDAETGYTWVHTPNGFSQYLTMSYRSVSAKNKIDELLYQYSYCIESVSLTSIPVYHLQPNTRIYVHDEHTKINGEYIVSKLTIPLAYNGTMSISAVRAPERLY